MLTTCRGWQTVSFASTKLPDRPGIQPQADAAVVTMDTDMATSLRNDERGGQTTSNLFNIHDNKKNVKSLLNQSLNAFKLIQHRCSTKSNGC